MFYSVETLMKSIASTFMIPMEKQVLIMQGGDALDPSHRICNYSSAGTVSITVYISLITNCNIRLQGSKFKSICTTYTAGI